MSPNIQIEARLLVLSMGLGAGLMASYDVLRLLRLMVRHSWLATRSFSTSIMRRRLPI